VTLEEMAREEGASDESISSFIGSVAIRREPTQGLKAAIVHVQDAKETQG
jgi:hypothetical protein